MVMEGVVVVLIVVRIMVGPARRVDGALLGRGAEGGATVGVFGEVRWVIAGVVVGVVRAIIVVDAAHRRHGSCDIGTRTLAVGSR